MLLFDVLEYKSRIFKRTPAEQSHTSKMKFLLVAIFVVSVQCSVSPDEVNFFYFSSEVDNTEIYANDSSLESVDVSLPIAFIIHGWEDDSNDTWVEDLTDLYVEKGEYNVITVDWAEPADSFYIVSVEDVRAVGES